MDRNRSRSYRDLPMTKTELIKKLMALESRLRKLAAKERAKIPLRSYDVGADDYERGYRVGLAVGYTEAAKRVCRVGRAR